MKLLNIVLFVFISLTAHAQMESPETLLDINNPDLVKTESTTTFTGIPAILIEPSQKKQAPQINPADLVPLLKLSQTPKEIEIKTLFGHDRTAPYLDHTTDFVILLQILDNQTLQVEEQIQFINTQKDKKFQRIFSKEISDKNGKKIALEIEPVSVYRDNNAIKPEITESTDNLTLTYPKTLPTGPNRFTIRYLIKGAIYQDRSLAEITLPLSGTNWPLVTERFSVVVSPFQKSNFYTNELTFGTNNQQIADYFTVKTDIKGNTVYQLTRPLPAYADVRLHTVLDAKHLPKAEKSLSDKFIILFIYFGILMAYVILSVIVCRVHKFKKALIKAKKVNPLLWRIEIGKPITSDLKKKTNNFGLRCFNPVLGKFLAFFRFNLEYIIGVILLTLCAWGISDYWSVQMPNILWFITSGFLAVLLIDIFGTRQEWKRFQDEIKRILLTTPQGLNLPPREIETYYILTICLDFKKEWVLKLTKNNPAYQDLPFIKKEK